MPKSTDDERFNIKWDPTLPSDARRRLCHLYGVEYGIREFVETGTNDGATCLHLADAFDHLYTIELNEAAYRHALTRFTPYPHIEAFLGDSAVVLPQVLEKLSGPAVFFIDAHFSGGTTARGPKDTPVCEELSAIFATGVPHVVLIDDARMFGGDIADGAIRTTYDAHGKWIGFTAADPQVEPSGDPAYPSIEWVRNLATSQDLEYKFSYVDDIMRLTPVV